MKKSSDNVITICEKNCSKAFAEKGPLAIETRFWAQLATRKYSNNGPYTLEWMKQYQVLGGVKK